MTDLRQAAMQVLKALDKLSKLGNGNQDGNSLGNTIAQEAREHLFTALAQPEQEPVPDALGHVGFQEWWDAVADGYEVNDFKKMRRAWNAALKHESQLAAQPEQVDCPRCGHVCSQRKWIGLTDEDMKDPQTHIFDFIYGARWAEAKLKERNT